MDDPQRPDERARERTESADFAPVRIGGRGRGGWAPMVIAGWVMLIAAVVAAGILGRIGKDVTAAAGGGPSAAPAASGPSILVIRDPAIAPAAGGPDQASAPDPVAYSVATDPAGFEITGTVLAREAVWVFISVQNLHGRVITWRSLSVDDPDGGIRPTRTPAFVAHVDVPARSGFGALVIEVNAYNNLGREIGSVRRIAGGPTRVIHLRTELTR